VRTSVRMDDKHSHVLAFALTVSWLLSIGLPPSHSQPPPPQLCGEQSYLCSKSISAVFDPPWEQIPASQCSSAHPSSLLSCHAPYDSIKVPTESQNFTVKYMDSTTRTMKLTPVNHVCSPNFFHSYQYFNNTLLLYNAPVHQITIFEHCPTITNFPSRRKFKCGDVLYYFVEGYKDYVMLYTYPELEDYCKGRLHVPAVAPLDRYNDTDDGASVLEQALNHAFQVNYSIIPDGCTKCRESEGTCWRDNYGEHVSLLSSFFRFPSVLSNN